MQAELWNEIRPFTQQEILGTMIRRELLREKVLRLDLSYLSAPIDSWWKQSRESNSTEHTIFSELQSLITSHIKAEHLAALQSVGTSGLYISAVFLEYVFSIPDKNLAKLVHEVMSKLAGIVDIKYPYEEHKELYPKDNGKSASDWGKGLGMIRPHSDDLYEERDINIMSLTVCNDTSKTPTWFWLVKDVVQCLSDEELGLLAISEATFYSGTNVEGQMFERKKPILRNDETEGLGLRLDFRIDDSIGPRMRFSIDALEVIVKKLREGLKRTKPLASNPSTGSVSVLANFKVLHGRSALNPVMLFEGEGSRILFRSKGIK